MDEAPVSQPRQADLDRLFNEAARVNVHWWGSVDGYELVQSPLVIESAELLEGLRVSARIAGPSSGRCWCMGDGALDFVAHTGEVIAQISIHHGEHLRWDDLWRTDAELFDGPGLLEWLCVQGLLRREVPEPG